MRHFPPASKSASLLGNGHRREKQGLVLPQLALGPRKAKARLGAQPGFQGKRGTLFSQPMCILWLSPCHHGSTKSSFKDLQRQAATSIDHLLGFFHTLWAFFQLSFQACQSGCTLPVCRQPPQCGIHGWDNTNHCRDVPGQDWVPSSPGLLWPPLPSRPSIALCPAGSCFVPGHRGAPRAVSPQQIRALMLPMHLALSQL